LVQNINYARSVLERLLYSIIIFNYIRKREEKEEEGERERERERERKKERKLN